MSISNFGGKLGMDGVNTLVDIDVDENIYGNNDRIDGSLGTSKWPLPLIFRFGISREFLFSETMKCLVAVDAIHPNNNPEYLNLGFEYSAMDMFFLRIGKSHTFYELKYNGENGRGSEQGLSFGGGIRYRIPRGPMLEVNYVVTNFGVFSDIQGYSFSLQF